MTSLVPLFLVFLISVVVSGWVNDFDEPLDVQCSSYLFAFSRFQSTHSNKKEDRRFDFMCRQVPAANSSVTCGWSGNVTFLSSVLHWPIVILTIFIVVTFIRCILRMVNVVMVLCIANLCLYFIFHVIMFVRS